MFCMPIFAHYLQIMYTDNDRNFLDVFLIFQAATGFYFMAETCDFFYHSSTGQFKVHSTTLFPHKVQFTHHDVYYTDCENSCTFKHKVKF